MLKHLKIDICVFIAYKIFLKHIQSSLNRNFLRTKTTYRYNATASGKVVYTMHEIRHFENEDEDEIYTCY